MVGKHLTKENVKKCEITDNIGVNYFGNFISKIVILSEKKSPLINTVKLGSIYNFSPLIDNLFNILY